MKVLLLLALPAVALAVGAPQQLLGGHMQVEDEALKGHEDIIQFALKELVESEKSLLSATQDCKLQYNKVQKFTHQVVAGKLYKFDLVMDQECSDEMKVCSMVVFDQPWTQTREVQWNKVACRNEAERENRFATSTESEEENSSSSEESTESSEAPVRKQKALPRVKLVKADANRGVVSSIINRFQKLTQESEEFQFNLLDGEQPKYLPHYKKGYKLIGGGDHDFVPHGKPLIGGDDHDSVPHGKKLLGGGDHDYVPHGKPLIGGDDHDSVPHVNNLVGGGDHDYVPHGKPLIGGDDHDSVPHGKPILGGDDHDSVPHGNKLLGGGDHDYLVHGLVGGGKPHGPRFDGVEDPEIDDNERIMRRLPPMEESLKKLKDMQSLRSFHSFMSLHGKVYASKAEYLKRYAIFKDNMKKVQFLQETELGTGVYGATHLADITEMEFKQKYLGMNLKKDDPDIHWPAADIPNVELPREFDWRTQGAVTPVKNQGMCGSCWAFSVTGNVEGQYAIKNKKLVSLSEQELVDCDKRDSGCNGGLPENAYKTLLEIGGLESESEYGYDGEDEQCKFNRSRVVARVKGGLEISQNETQMAQWLLKNGPISVGLNANAMQFYMGGVSHPWKFLCSPDGIDHGVLIVGFGIHEYPLFHKTMPYWIIKNSWGTGWGEQGYYRLYRGDGTCGINMMTSSAVLDD